MNPIRTEHALSPKDAATVQAIRQQSAPFKGMMTGPEARPGYDAIIEAVPQAEAVSYEEAVLGGVAGMWCRPPSARGHPLILFAITINNRPDFTSIILISVWKSAFLKGCSILVLMISSSEP